jgi:hypothetical protein
VLTVVGGTAVGGSATMTVTGVSAGVITAVTVLAAANYSVAPTNPTSVTGGTGSGATFNLAWGISTTFVISTAGSGYLEVPTITISGGGGVNATAYATVGGTSILRATGAGSSVVSGQALNINTANGPAMVFRDVANADTYPLISPASSYTQIVAYGSTNGNLFLASNGTGFVSIRTNGLSQAEQFRVTNTTGAVNYVNVTGSTSGNRPTISVQGTDTNADLVILAKGTNAVQIGNSTQGWGLSVIGGTNSINRFQVSGAAQGTGPILSVVGNDSNIDATIQTAGTGKTNIRSDLSVKNIYAQGGNNLVLWSQDLTQGSWGKTSGASIGTGITAPDGTATANSITSSVTDGYIYQSPIQNTTQPFSTYTMSLWLKVPTGTLSFPVYLIDGGGASYLSQQTCALTTSWQRFSVTRTTSAYITTGLNVQIGGASALGVGAVIHVWGIQVEPGPGVSYYLPTTSSIITSANTVTASSFKYTNGEVPGYTYQLDDISNRFNGSTVSFPLTYNNGTAIAPNNPNKVNITIGNVPVKPAFYIRDYFNLPEFAVFTQGYVISGSTITFATPPLRGMNFYGDVRTNQDLAPTFPFKQAPFSALNIMSRS